MGYAVKRADQSNSSLMWVSSRYQRYFQWATSGTLSECVQSTMKMLTDEALANANTSEEFLDELFTERPIEEKKEWLEEQGFEFRQERDWEGPKIRKWEQRWRRRGSLNKKATAYFYYTDMYQQGLDDSLDYAGEYGPIAELIDGVEKVTIYVNGETAFYPPNSETRYRGRTAESEGYSKDEVEWDNNNWFELVFFVFVEGFGWDEHSFDNDVIDSIADAKETLIEAMKIFKNEIGKVASQEVINRQYDPNAEQNFLKEKEQDEKIRKWEQRWRKRSMLKTIKIAESEDIKVVWKVNTDAGQKIGNKQIIKKPTLKEFTKEILPRTRQGFYGGGTEKQQYQNMLENYPLEYISYVKSDLNEGWVVARIASLDYIMEELNEGISKNWAKIVDDFESPEAIQWRQTSDSDLTKESSLIKKAVLSIEEVEASLKRALGEDEIFDFIEDNDYSGSGYFKTNDAEYHWIIDEDTAYSMAIEQVRNDLDHDPEMFTQSWLHSHIDEDAWLDDLRSDLESMVFDAPDSYTTYIDNEEPAEENGDYSDEQIERMQEAYIQEIRNRGVLEYVTQELGYEGDSLAEQISPYIDWEEASEDAVDTDGWAHFLSHYDGEYETTAEGVVYFKESESGYGKIKEWKEKEEAKKKEEEKIRQWEQRWRKRSNLKVKAEQSGYEKLYELYKPHIDETVKAKLLEIPAIKQFIDKNIPPADWEDLNIGFWQYVPFYDELKRAIYFPEDFYHKIMQDEKDALPTIEEYTDEIAKYWAEEAQYWNEQAKQWEGEISIDPDDYADKYVNMVTINQIGDYEIRMILHELNHYADHLDRGDEFVKETTDYYSDAEKTKFDMEKYKQSPAEQKSFLTEIEYLKSQGHSDIDIIFKMIMQYGGTDDFWKPLVESAVKTAQGECEECGKSESEEEYHQRQKKQRKEWQKAEEEKIHSWKERWRKRSQLKTAHLTKKAVWSVYDEQTGDWMQTGRNSDTLEEAVEAMLDYVEQDISDDDAEMLQTATLDEKVRLIEDIWEFTFKEEFIPDPNEDENSERYLEIEKKNEEKRKKHIEQQEEIHRWEQRWRKRSSLKKQSRRLDRLYECEECGKQEIHKTNHRDTIYPYCSYCVKPTNWNCIRDIDWDADEGISLTLKPGNFEHKRDFYQTEKQRKEEEAERERQTRQWEERWRRRSSVGVVV